jgi:hypothetical protein
LLLPALTLMTQLQGRVSDAVNICDSKAKSETKAGV